MSTRLHGLPVRRPDVSLVDEADRSRLVPLGGAETHVLNPTARAIWELCDGTTAPDEMVDAICQVFSVEPDRATQDVHRTLGQLTEAQLIDWPQTAASRRT